MTKLKTAGRPKGVFAVETYRIIDKIHNVFKKNPDQSFNTADIIRILGKSLKDVNNANVRVRMWLDHLCDENKLKYLGVKAKASRGRPSKEYILHK